MKKLKNSLFINSRLENNNVEKIGWRKSPVIKRLESALLWGKEIDWLQKKLYGKTIILKKLKKDLERM